MKILSQVGTLKTGEVEREGSTSVEEESIEDPEEILMESCPLFITFLTEFLGTAFQMFVGCLGSTYTYDTGPFLTMFSFGLGRLAVYEMFNHINPVHVNPAKSLGFFILGRMHFWKFFVYVVAQHLGTIAGTAYAMAVTPSNLPLICVVRLHGIGQAQGFALEFVTTLILMIAVAAGTDPANEHNRESLSLRIGMVVMGLILSIDHLSSAGKNPSRSFAPSLLYNNWEVHWLYHAGPYLGAALGASMYRFIYDPHQKYSLHKMMLKRRGSSIRSFGQ